MRDVHKLIDMGLMGHPEDGTRAKREIILAVRLPLVLDLGLYIAYYFGVKPGAWRYIYGNRYPKKKFQSVSTKRSF